MKENKSDSQYLIEQYFNEIKESDNLIQIPPVESFLTKSKKSYLFLLKYAAVFAIGIIVAFGIIYYQKSEGDSRDKDLAIIKLMDELDNWEAPTDELIK